ncbi:EAL domain-containing protein [Massilia sp. DWR3-1-1]|uniref:EAL domain-containing protein n=1 Tax=Massilia sp. DWR3-1-1 TaxID=2804559 RepID=UPI003CE7522A
MAFPALNDYLARLGDAPSASASVWRSADGRVHEQFFNCTLTSAFQPIHALGADGAAPAALEALARGASGHDAGLSLWRMLDHAASDDQSVELDRLCRMLHAINFFRQAEAGDGDLYLSVHDRLLSAVSSNHGYAFRRILAALGLPAERIVLQLPAVGAASRWLANYVADNYRRNGFRLAFNAASIADAMDAIGQFQPHAVKIDARVLRDGAALPALLELAQGAGVTVIVKRLDSAAGRALIERAAAHSGATAWAQGYLMDTPRAALSALRQGPLPAAPPTRTARGDEVGQGA